jgi:hypothetical protein
MTITEKLPKWDIQYNQGTHKFELTDGGFTVLELTISDLTEIGVAVSRPLYKSTRSTVKVIRDLVA